MGGGSGLTVGCRSGIGGGGGLDIAAGGRDDEVLVRISLASRVGVVDESDIPDVCRVGVGIEGAD